jgi:hypothetical protein
MFAEYRKKWNGFTNPSDVDKAMQLRDEGGFAVFKLWAIVHREERP